MGKHDKLSKRDERIDRSRETRGEMQTLIRMRRQILVPVKPDLPPAEEDVEEEAQEVEEKVTVAHDEGDDNESSADDDLNSLGTDSEGTDDNDSEDDEESEDEQVEETAAPSPPKRSAKAAAAPKKPTEWEAPKVTAFKDLPLSSRTLEGLQRGNYTRMTPIQSEVLPWALAGRDILAAAKTGSGKTLAFIIPVLERLFVESWDEESGLGALIITPTRELALQIFKVLRLVGGKHTYSAALLTGGRNADEEKKRLSSMNIVVGTPGRLRHHLTESEEFSLDQLQVFVMDEADRLLDMGFRGDIQAIVSQLPSSTQQRTIYRVQRNKYGHQKQGHDDSSSSDDEKTANDPVAQLASIDYEHSRQTLLFSATQTNDVQSLALLTMKPNPKYVTDFQGVSMTLAGAPGTAGASTGGGVFQSMSFTPTQICHNFIMMDLHRKLDGVLAFLKRHPNDKTIVFLSTCNQVRYYYLAISKLLKKVKVPAMCLTGKMRQFRREEVFSTFCRCKSAVLFCTDIASRGLDFPMVHWVVQADCPDSAQTYIHRAGRTARAGARGVSLLFLMPSEAAFLVQLWKRRIPMREIAIKPHMLHETRQLFQAMVVQGLKYDAQKAFISYLRSVKFAENKTVFQLQALDPEKYAKSLGLLMVPDLREVIGGNGTVGSSFNRNNLGDLHARPVGGAGNTADDDDVKPRDKNVPWAVVNHRLEVDRMKKNNGAAEDDHANMTRRERHWNAADMFTQMDVKQKYSTAGAMDAFLSGGGAQAEQEDMVLTKKPVGAPAITAPATQPTDKAQPTRSTELQGVHSKATNTLELTADLRMQGLSKHKVRNIVQAADLMKLPELHLYKKTVFESSDDDDAPADRKKTKKRTAAEDDLEEATQEDAGVEMEMEHLMAVKAALEQARPQDKAHVKDLKRARKRLKDDKAAAAAEKDAEEDKGGAASDSDGAASADSHDSDEVTQEELLAAMRGELFTKKGPEGTEKALGGAAEREKPAPKRGPKKSVASKKEDAPVPAGRQVRPHTKRPREE